MATRTNISSGAPYEPIFGYSRAVKIGNQIFVSGSTAIQPDGTVAGVGDPYAQAIATFRTIEKALQQAGASMRNVVRTRMFATDISQTEAIGKAHAEFFRDIRPASTLVEVSRLVHPDMLIEIEADAVISD
jgi:enamine deaminase RidA (YjgF/YER057c/UK114 family)